MAVVRFLRAGENALGPEERPTVKVIEDVTYSCSRPNQGTILGERHLGTSCLTTPWQQSLAPQLSKFTSSYSILRTESQHEARNPLG